MKFFIQHLLVQSLQWKQWAKSVKVNNKDTRTRSGFFSKKWKQQNDVNDVIVISLLWTYFAYCFGVSIDGFEQVNDNWGFP